MFKIVLIQNKPHDIGEAPARPRIEPTSFGIAKLRVFTRPKRLTQQGADGSFLNKVVVGVHGSSPFGWRYVKRYKFNIRLRLAVANPPISLDFVSINRNFMHKPLAIGPRVGVNWENDKKLKCVGYDASENVRVLLPFRRTHRVRKHIDAFDMALLCVLMTISKKKHVTELHVTAAELLSFMGVHNAKARDRARLLASLRLWNVAELAYEGTWGFVGKAQSLRLGPFIKYVKSIPLIGYQIKLGEADIEMAVGAGYYEQVPLPLPLDAWAQNLLFLLLAKYERNKTKLRKREFRSIRSITRRIGLNNSGSRNKKFYDALSEVEEWFVRNNSRLHSQIDPKTKRMYFEFYWDR